MTLNYAHAIRLALPEIVLVLGALIPFCVAIIRPRRGLALAGTLLCVGVAMAVTLGVTTSAGQGVFGWQEAEIIADYGPQAHAISPFAADGVAAFTRWMVLATTVLIALLGWREYTDNTAGEYLGCLLVAAAGTSLAARANDLISIYLALELISVPTYVLLALPARTRIAQEAAVKYFLLSVLSSAILLFGFSYLYGLTGSTNLGALTDTLATAHRDAGANPLAMVAAVLVIAGLAFRITAVPFHFYAPDVYEGGPTGVIGFLAVMPKIAGFLALARILGLLPPSALSFDAATTLIPLTLWVVAAVTMTFGNILALWQENLKRLMAYSGIAHGGYMLISLVVVSNGVPDSGGIDAVIVYLVAYTLMTLGVFAVLIHLNAAPHPVETVDDLAGLGSSHPVSAAALSVCVLSLIGLPLTAGFVGKFLIFLGAFELPASAPMQNSTRILAIIAAVNAAIGAVYYLRLLNVMFLRSPLRDPVPSRGASLPRAIAVLCAIGTLALGVYPKPLVDAAREAAIPTSTEPTP